jgi:Flp pilus assembly pilin Flp
MKDKGQNRETNKMKKIWSFVEKVLKEEEGMETVEYAVVGALVIVVVLVAWTGLGNAIRATIENLTTQISA